MAKVSDCRVSSSGIGLETPLLLAIINFHPTLLWETWTNVKKYFRLLRRKVTNRNNSDWR